MKSLQNKKNPGNHPHHKLEVITSYFQVDMSHGYQNWLQKKI